MGARSELKYLSSFVHDVTVDRWSCRQVGLASPPGPTTPYTPRFAGYTIFSKRMNEIPFIDDPNEFLEELRRIQKRRIGQEKIKRKYRLTKRERKIILGKTDGKCHVCGRDVSIEKFEADHVKSHSSGGTSVTNNFLPACRTCNNYRWNYLSDEFQWILKLGVWARTEIANDSKLGNAMAGTFIGREKIREKRRKNPRK